MTELDPNRPPSTLQDALDIVKDWENGLINNLSPDGLAVALFLQEANLRKLGGTATIGIEA
jgi:hypothetical protein